VGFGLTFIAWYLASVFFMVDALRHEYRAGTDQLPDITVQRLVAGRPGLIDPSGVDSIGEIPGVIRVQPRVWGYVFFPSLSGNLTVVAADLSDPQVKADLAGLVVDVGIGLEVAGRYESALYEGDVLVTDVVTARSLLNLRDDEVTDLAVWIATPERGG
jgi:hypothetical protein